MHQTGGLRNEEANVAAWEAGKGAAVGGAKVIDSSCVFGNQLFRMFVDCDPVVGLVCSCIGGCWICSFSYIQRIDDSIQSVSQIAVYWAMVN